MRSMALINVVPNCWLWANTHELLVRCGCDFHQILTTKSQAVSDAEAIEVLGQGGRKLPQLFGIGHWHFLKTKSLLPRMPLPRLRVPAGKRYELFLKRTVGKQSAVESGPRTTSSNEAKQFITPRVIGRVVVSVPLDCSETGEARPRAVDDIVFKLFGNRLEGLLQFG